MIFSSLSGLEEQILQDLTWRSLSLLSKVSRRRRLMNKWLIKLYQTPLKYKIVKPFEKNFLVTICLWEVSNRVFIKQFLNNKSSLKEPTGLTYHCRHFLHW